MEKKRRGTWRQNDLETRRLGDEEKIFSSRLSCGPQAGMGLEINDLGIWLEACG